MDVKGDDEELSTTRQVKARDQPDLTIVGASPSSRLAGVRGPREGAVTSEELANCVLAGHDRDVSICGEVKKERQSRSGSPGYPAVMSGELGRSLLAAPRSALAFARRFDRDHKEREQK